MAAKLLKRTFNTVAAAACFALSAQYAIAGPVDNGGPIMLGTPNVYLIWYGNWAGDTSTSIVPNFLQNLGGSSWYNINTSYYNAAGDHPSNSLNYGGSYFQNEYLGNSLSDAQVLQIVDDTLAQNGTAADNNSIYLVLTSGDVHEQEDGGACGWHYNSQYVTGNGDTKFGWIKGSIQNCSYAPYYPQYNWSPNNNVLADGMISIISHEISETVTDPELDAFWDSNQASATFGNENADMCAWRYGPRYTSANGAFANENIGGKDYLIQENWVYNPDHANGGYCAQGYAPEPDMTALLGLGAFGLLAARRRRAK